MEDTFNNSKVGNFEFFITSEKVFPNTVLDICHVLNINPEQTVGNANRTNTEIVEKIYRFAFNLHDFLLRLDERDLIDISTLSIEIIENVKALYLRNRESSNDTGKLIYRMHSMGLLKDYMIDYNKNNLYCCTLIKHKKIDPYIDSIELFLKRYLSEVATIEYLKKLKKRLKGLKGLKTCDQIIECLHFLSEFADTEIASKRKRATDEIENMLNTSISNPAYANNWYEQNIFIKEQIYFYFNAKYSRSGYKINGNDYSLLDDYKSQLNDKKSTLFKYIAVLNNEGAAQNNYKHMIGSCKKIIRSLPDTELKKEWLLRLLKAFSLYSVNNQSYISEANEELELGFLNLYNDINYHQNNFQIIEEIYNQYFDELENNLEEENHSFNDIKLIRLKILLDMQRLGIEKITETKI